MEKFFPIIPFEALVLNEWNSFSFILRIYLQQKDNNFLLKNLFAFLYFFPKVNPDQKKHSKKPTCLSEYRLCFQLNLSKTNMDFSVLPKKYYYNTTRKAIIPDMRSCALAFCGFSQENILISLVPFFFFLASFFRFLFDFEIVYAYLQIWQMIPLRGKLNGRGSLRNLKDEKKTEFD